MGPGSSPRRCTSARFAGSRRRPRDDRPAAVASGSPLNHVCTWLVCICVAGCAPVPPPAPANAAAGEDWPCFLGPRHDSTSAETGILTTWPAGGLRVVWQAPLGDGFGPPAVS